MIALALLLQLATAVPPPPLPAVATWPDLPVLPLTQRLPEEEALSAFVRDEVAAGRCVVEDGTRLTVDMAVLVDRAGTVRRIVPRAIGCPTVEQYAVGLVARLARGNLAPPAADGWYRIAAPFSWR